MSSPIKRNCNRTIECPTRVCLPVAVTPFVVQGTTTTTCNGQPTITPGNSCSGVENGTCAFTVTQNIDISIPIELGSESSVGPPYVQCMIAPTIEDPPCGRNPDSGNNHRKSGQLKDTLI